MERATREVFNPAMLILAREAQGLSQSEFVEQINRQDSSFQLTQSRLSRIEAGLAAPNETLVQVLVVALGYDRGFFYEPALIFPLSHTHYRKLKTMPARASKQLAARINIERIRVNKLLQSVELSVREIPYLEIDGYRFKDASAIARAVRRSWHLPKGPIQNMTTLMEQAGNVAIPLRVASRQFSGASIVCESGQHIVTFNSTMPSDRVRYTMAHELGHIVMHTLPDQRENAEKEANDFASEFLMPEAEIRDELYSLDLERAAALKMQWKVSIASIILRAKELGSIGRREHEKLWMQMNKLGYRRQEPRNLVIEDERPRLLHDMVEVHLSQLGYTNDELRTYLHLTPFDLADYLDRPRTKLKLLVGRDGNI